MNRGSYTILRVGCGAAFFWIAVLIFRSPLGWGLMMQPWALALLPIQLNYVMYGNAIFNVIIGVMLLTENKVWLASLLAVLHFILIFIVVGINEITIRDLGLLAAVTALFWESFPKRA